VYIKLMRCCDVTHPHKAIAQSRSQDFCAGAALHLHIGSHRSPLTTAAGRREPIEFQARPPNASVSVTRKRALCASGLPRDSRQSRAAAGKTIQFVTNSRQLVNGRRVWPGRLSSSIKSGRWGRRGRVVVQSSVRTCNGSRPERGRQLLERKCLWLPVVAYRLGPL
jgi:hypothetical protein